jgi:hypothetical protein
MKMLLLAATVSLGLVGVASAGSAPSMSTGSLRDNRSHAECLDYSVKVIRVPELEHIRTPSMEVYGQSPGINFVIRCETGANAVFFAAAGGEDGDKVEGLLQILIRQFQITKDLPKCDRNSSPLHLCQ